MSPRDVIAKWQKAREARGTFLDLWDSLARVFRPWRDDFYGHVATGERRNEEIFDASPIEIQQRLVYMLGGLLRPRETQWFRIETDDEALNEVDGVKRWLDHVTDLTFKAIYARAARFQPEASAWDADTVTFGTGVMFMGVNRSGDKLMYKSLHLRDCYILDNADGQVDTMVVHLRLSARQAAERYGADSLPRKVSDALRSPSDGKADEKFGFVWCVQPREYVQRGKVDLRGMPFHSVVVDEEGETVVSEGGFREFPFAVSRWDTATGEVYGRSPAMIALGDANTLQAMGRTLLTAGQRAADPPHWTVADGSIGVPRLYPGGITYVDTNTLRATGGRQPMGPIMANGNIPLTREMQADFRDQVARAFLQDVIRLPLDDKVRTAYEIAQRKQEYISIIGPVLAQHETELGRIPERAFAIMMRAGAFPPPPEELEGREVNFVYESPITQARRQAQSANVTQALEMLGPAISLDPSIVDNWDFDAISRDTAESLGFRMEWLRSQDDVQQLRQQRAEMQQQQMQLQQAQLLADAANRGAGAAKQIAEVGGGGRA